MKWVIIILFTIMVLFIFFDRIGESDKYLKSIQLTGIPAKKESFQKATDVNTAVRMEKLLKLIELSNVPVKLYGVVVDENERPVSGAVVSWRVGQGGYFNSPPPIRKKSITDSKGLFTIDGVRGTSLGFDEITKEGYHQAYNGYSVDHQNPSSQKANPLKFLILKNDVPDATDLEFIDSNLNWNGAAVRIPFGIEGLELVVLAIRDQEIKPGLPFSWSVDITMPGGSFKEISDEPARLAPTEGYQPSVKFERKATDLNYNDIGDKNVAFKTSKNKYGVFRLRFNPSGDSIDKSFHLYAQFNEHGLRNMNPSH